MLQESQPRPRPLHTHTPQTPAVRGCAVKGVKKARDCPVLAVRRRKSRSTWPCRLGGAPRRSCPEQAPPPPPEPRLPDRACDGRQEPNCSSGNGSGGNNNNNSGGGGDAAAEGEAGGAGGDDRVMQAVGISPAPRTPAPRAIPRPDSCTATPAPRTAPAEASPHTASNLLGRASSAARRDPRGQAGSAGR